MSTHTLAISPEHDIEPGAHIRAFVTIGDGSVEPTPVTLRVAVESRDGHATGSTQARWMVTSNDEIEFVCTLPRSRPLTKNATAALPESAPGTRKQAVSPQALRLLEETRFLGLLRHLFAVRALAPEGAFPEKTRAQLDRLYIKLRLPNYILSERDIEATPAFWLEQAQQLPPELQYKTPLVEAFEALCTLEPGAFLDALQHTENRDLDEALDSVLESLRACS